jgi:hypothetical protein
MIAGFGPQPLHHGAGQVDAVHRHAAGGQRQRQPAGPDAEFEGPASTGQLGQHVGRGVHRVGFEHVGR